MCGIWAQIKQGATVSDKNAIVKRFNAFMQLKHRGPDHTSFQTFGDQVEIGFHRLAIMKDNIKTHQPFVYELAGESIVFVCNGEIYNYKKLNTMFLKNDECEFPTKRSREYISPHENDCSILGQIVFEHMAWGGEQRLRVLIDLIREHVRGEYAFMAFQMNKEKKLTRWIACRDQIGVRPLYYATETDGSMIFSSEIKGFPSTATDVREFPPGHLMIGEPMKEPQWVAMKPVYATLPSYVGDNDDGYHLQRVRESVVQSVARRLDADKPLFFLLSGGVDSSLVAAIAAAHLKGKTIRTACCGMRAGTYSVNGGTEFRVGEGSDLGYARQVAAHIGSSHVEVLFSPQEGIDAIRDVIRTIESWDTTTVRASVGQYMVCKWIAENTDAKVVLVGEGPDEVCSSYLFNEFAPSGRALHDTALEYVDRVHLYDGRRVDRCVARWGLEARVPLLDPEFIQAYWEIPSEERRPVTRGIEKWWLREAFAPSKDEKEQGLLPEFDASLNREPLRLLPETVRMRKKSAFSDSMTSEKSWYAILAEWAETQVTDAELAAAAEVFPYCTPQTKEAYVYRRIFCEELGADRQAVLPGYWQPKWNAHGETVRGYMDPSALVLRGDAPQKMEESLCLS